MRDMFSKYVKIEGALSPVINTLRGLSSIVVLIGHGFQIFLAQFYPVFFPIFGLFAQAAVMMFFVLSGFLITKSLTRNAAEENGFEIKTYIMDRLDRIYPPLLFALFLILILLLLVPTVFPLGSTKFQFFGEHINRNGFDASLQSWLGTLVFANGFLVGNISANGPLWSLPFEVWYYVIAGLIVWRPTEGTFVGLALLLLLGILNKFFLVYSVVWFAGAGVAILHNHQIRIIILAKVASITALAMSAIIGYIYYQSFMNADLAPNGLGLILMLYNLMFGIGIAISLHLLVSGAIRLKPILPNTARFSYTLYVIHFPIMLFIYGIMETQIWESASGRYLAMCIALLASLFIAWSLAPIIENMRPMRWVSTRVKNKQ